MTRRTARSTTPTTAPSPSQAPERSPGSPGSPNASQAADAAQEDREQAQPTQEPETPQDPRRRRGSPLPSDAEVRDRFTRYSRHVAPHPARRTRVPDVLAHLPAFVECAEERQAVREVEARLAGERSAWSARNDSARRHHQDAQRRALLDGARPPGPLVLEPWPYPENELDTFTQLHQVIEAKELSLLEDHAERWAQALDGSANEIRTELAEAQRVVAELQARLAPYVTAIDSLEGHRNVDDRIVRPGARSLLTAEERAVAEEHMRLRATGGVVQAASSARVGRR